MRTLWLLALLITICVASATAQPTRAIVVDGSGPWRDDRWVFTAGQFTAMLSDAGYPVTTVAPADLASALGSPDIFLAVPSLESLPFDTMNAIISHVQGGGNLMASGGEPFRDPLYLAPNGTWLDAAAYQQTVGSLAPPLLPPVIPTLSPWYQQFTNSAGIRYPVARQRGITSILAFDDTDGRYRAIGDLVAPAATIFTFQPINLISRGIVGSIVWLPWPQPAEPFRSQLVAALHADQSGLHLVNAGPDQVLWLPGESITGMANVQNVSTSSAPATLQWSISGSAGVMTQPAFNVPAAVGKTTSMPFSISLPTGDYTMSFRLMLGSQEVDRIDSPVRVLDPLASRQPDQKIRVVNGAFYAGGKRVYLHGVNYWPRFVVGLPGYLFGNSWLEPITYDPELIEADLSLIESLGFNLVNFQYVDLQLNWPQQARSLMDFLERCRNHGIWARIYLPTTTEDNAYTGSLNPKLGAYLQGAYLPGNDRVFSYELLWEPYIGFQNQGGYGGFVGASYVYNVGRTILDPDWRAWVNDQYGSLANAEQIWGLAVPLDAKGQLTNPTDDQVANDGPWRVMVDAYRRFMEDDLGRNLGVVEREIRRNDPDTLLSYRNWSTMTSVSDSSTGYDLGTGAAHLDFLSPENYDAVGWPEHRKWGFATAYSRFRSGGKPVQWAEFGYDIGLEYGTPASRAAQGAVCDTFMRQIADDGADADSVWFWPGGLNPTDQADFGIIDPDGTPRDCAVTLSEWGATFRATPPDVGPGSPVTLTVDRDSDARGEYGLFLKWADAYASARAAGQPVVVVDQGTGTDTSSMPLVQVGNAAYSGTGPLKFANAEFGGIRIVCPNLDVTVENNSQVQIPAGASCQMTATLVNSGEAQWLATGSSKGGVILHTSLGDGALASAVPALQRISIGPIAFSMGQSTVNLTGRMVVRPSNAFGEMLRLTLPVDSTGTGSCATALSPSGPISAAAGGSSASIAITAPATCAWTASSPQPWVTVTPTAGTGSGQATYTIPANIGPARQTTITVAGHPFAVSQSAGANPAAAQMPALSASSLDFGSLTVGATSAAQTVTLTNSGTAALNIGMVSLGGLNATDFAQTNTCGSSVAASASCRLSVSFTPSSAGARAAAVFITGNAGPIAIKLSGAGVGTGPMPTIQAIVDAWDYTPGIAPGLWAAIGGLNLAAFAQTANFPITGPLPTSLADVTVTFNGAPAALLYVSPQQVDALVPASVAPGPVQVVVQVNGVNSSPFSITAKATQPAIYALPNANASTFFVTAALQGTGFLVGNSTVDSRVARAVFPGDVLDLYMLGLGATADATKFITNTAFAGAFPVSAPVTVTVGGKPAPVIFAGLTSPGLYLVRVSVPTGLTPGTQTIQVSTGSAATGGAQTRPELALTIGTPGANLIQNGSFESPLAGNWNLSVNSAEGAAASIQASTSTSVDGSSSAQVTVSAASTPPGDIQAVRLSESGIALQQGQVYRLVFSAKADTGRTIRFDMVGAAANNDGLTSAIALSNDWQQYVIYFQATATDPAARIDFYFGDQAGNTWLDAISLQGTTP